MRRDGVHLLLKPCSDRAEYSFLTWFLSSTALHGGFPSRGIFYHWQPALSFTPALSCGSCGCGSWGGCGDHQLDPVNCPFGTVLEFLQDDFSAGLAHSTLKIYMAAIAAYHAPLGGLSVGKTLYLHVSTVSEARELMLSGGPGCYPITLSPLISPRLWESRLTQLKVLRRPRPFRYCNAAGCSTPLTFIRFLTKICKPLLALLSLATAVLFHTRQGFASLATWISHSPSVRRSSSSRNCPFLFCGGNGLL